MSSALKLLIFELQKSIQEFKAEKLSISEKMKGELPSDLLQKIKNLDQSIESVEKQIELLKSEEYA